MYEDDMSWTEFEALLCGLGEDTPLGKVVSTRTETNEEIIKYFTPHQKKIRREWQKKRAKAVPQSDFTCALEQMKQALLAISAKS